MNLAREYAYVRVSAKDQNEDRQRKAMEDIGIKPEFIFVDKASGKDFERPDYKLLKRVLQAGDTVFIKEIDRFGRNKQEILKEWQWMVENKIDVVVVDMPILDTRKYKELGGVGQLITDIILQLFSWLAEEERTKIKQRQLEGIAAAKSKGKHLGRPKIVLTKEQQKKIDELYFRWKKREITAVYFMNELGLKKNTFYNVMKEYEQQIKELKKKK
ncbi:recombinase family protein [Brevibacillus laterosporus]|uniref:Recombinase family protein n=1 Tax=Brevibacillus laterosporus TaxID=1465 RepID=A0AAP3GE31_BRELA|nr:recombinase family protein [Brevibacillus laterosporus]MCR8982453.1 recombinase family protein [Brevibacillus laterosporus]MCZ0809609.1 recombinase family protein [Brevibacillus laterosporus]MCZ0828142.1 recombinase family protein [Brevibacillus laterosporus]MCZ0852164.1 recombinase family protein [Brevibacillus laterosporus]